MNYIKLFEAYGDDGFVPPHLMTKFKNEIKSFCYDYLSFLIDDGFIIEVTEQYTNLHQPMDSVLIDLKTDNFNFKWDYIKDVFIPFYTVLSNNYNVGIDRHNLIVRYISNNTDSDKIEREYFYSSDVIDDNILSKLNDENCDIVNLKIQVEYKKLNKSLSFHAKNFNKRSEIKEFSNNYLSYLLDDGFNLKVKEEYASYDITISTNIPRLRNLKAFEWGDVSDYLIPYLIMLKKTYDVRTQIFFHTVWTSKYVTYNRVLNDSYEKPTEITNIIIRIKK